VPEALQGRGPVTCLSTHRAALPVPRAAGWRWSRGACGGGAGTPASQAAAVPACVPSPAGRAGCCAAQRRWSAPSPTGTAALSACWQRHGQDGCCCAARPVPSAKPASAPCDCWLPWSAKCREGSCSRCCAARRLWDVTACKACFRPSEQCIGGRLAAAVPNQAPVGCPVAGGRRLVRGLGVCRRHLGGEPAGGDLSLPMHRTPHVWLPNRVQMSYSACQIAPVASYWFQLRRPGSLASSGAQQLPSRSVHCPPPFLLSSFFPLCLLPGAFRLGVCLPVCIRSRRCASRDLPAARCPTRCSSHACLRSRQHGDHI
jgi:hypothetical protein